LCVLTSYEHVFLLIAQFRFAIFYRTVLWLLLLPMSWENSFTFWLRNAFKFYCYHYIIHTSVIGTYTTIRSELNTTHTHTHTQPRIKIENKFSRHRRNSNRKPNRRRTPTRYYIYMYICIYCTHTPAPYTHSTCTYNFLVYKFRVHVHSRRAYTAQTHRIYNISSLCTRTYLPTNIYYAYTYNM